MAMYNVTRSIDIKAPLETIKTSLIDYKQWPIWSPWLLMDSKAEVDFSDIQGEVDSAYSWKGELVGAGNMKLERITETQLQMKLTFLAPFKSSAQVTFDLTPKKDENSEKETTTVKWTMVGKVPFFLLFMRKKMQAYIGMDYDRGLGLLKEYIETGSVVSLVNINGIKSQPEQKYIGIANQCTLNEMGEVMSEGFRKLHEFAKDNQLVLKDVPFTIYNEFDVIKQRADFITALPIDQKLAKLKKPFIQGRVVAREMIQVMHTGSYQHLGNGWGAAMAYARANKIKTRECPIGIEYYLSDPLTERKKDLITEIGIWVAGK